MIWGIVGSDENWPVDAIRLLGEGEEDSLVRIPPGLEALTKNKSNTKKLVEKDNWCGVVKSSIDR